VPNRAFAWSQTVLPPRLRPGDTVAVPAPAGWVKREALQRGLELLSSRYRVVFDESETGLFAQQGFLAGSDERRADELNRYMGDPDVRAIISARGGYGVMRILDRLDGALLRRDPKLIVGFSDLTALLAWAANEANLRPVHGPMVGQIGRLPPEDLAWLQHILEEPTPIGRVPGATRRVGDRGNGTVEGRLVGGNLELVSRLIGTPWAMDLGASVFLMEDVGERPYRIDRMLTQLRLAGALQGVRGIAAGEFLRCVEPDGLPPTVTDVLDERLLAFQIPGVVDLPVGHGERNLAMPLGARCALDLAEGTLVIEDAAVA
jgi:muramoyltetrapeptide carboxypeptidase